MESWKDCTSLTRMQCLLYSTDRKIYLLLTSSTQSVRRSWSNPTHLGYLVINTHTQYTPPSSSTSSFIRPHSFSNRTALRIQTHQASKDKAIMQRTQGYQQHRTQYQNRNYCCEGHMIIGFILSLASAILLYVYSRPQYLHIPFDDMRWDKGKGSKELTARTLVSLSTPLIKQITFLNTPFYRYGAFGYCSTEGDCVHVTGYSTGPEIREWMTETTALFPVGTSLLQSCSNGYDIGRCTDK